MNEKIEKFVNSLTYYEQIHLLMSYYMSNDSALNRVNAFKKATIHYGDEHILSKSLESMVSMGPTNR